MLPDRYLLTIKAGSKITTKLCTHVLRSETHLCRLEVLPDEFGPEREELWKGG